MFIAAKFQEIYPPIMSDFTFMTNESVKAQDMLAMEASVLYVIQFDVNVTPS